MINAGKPRDVGLASGNDLDALSGDIEGRDGQEEPEAREGESQISGDSTRWIGRRERPLQYQTASYIPRRCARRSVHH